ncbi:MAG: 2-dehydro-3-deoxy-6-phosphogalactonate aldolase [Pseudomonadota bacterium]
MSLQERWNRAVETLPLVAILRGITHDESIAVAEQLVEAGFSLIEVPLNSPSPLQSIEKIQQHVGDRALVGAGTVLTDTQVHNVINAGGQLIIAPNFSTGVAAACATQNVIYCPGVTTPTEAFNALDAGATALKLFPAEMIPPPVVKAMRAVLPADTALLPVGGISPSNMKDYIAAGAKGFGIGSAIYKAGKSAPEVYQSAKQFVSAYNAAVES